MNTPQNSSRAVSASLPRQSPDMSARRKSGILLHITSLPGTAGVGNFGGNAYRIVDFLERTGQSLWQVLPLGPTGYGNSPYQCYSAFAGNPLLISIERLQQEGLLEPLDLTPEPHFSEDVVDFDHVIAHHQRLLHIAFKRFQTDASAGQRADIQQFAESHSAWLDDYALFQALKDASGGRAWHTWRSTLRSREPTALATARKDFAESIDFERFVQYHFFRQWKALKQYANERGISIIGDIPIFVAHDSADVWARQELFSLNPDGTPAVVAGVPPDYFSATGQLWGNPLYDWHRMAETGYEWWIERLRGSLNLFDAVRVDHFRGFESYWEVPGDAKTAAGGRWVAGPRAAMFQAAQKALGPMPIIAEDLGVITSEVDALRDQLGMPGMRVLQFAFGDDPKANDYKPHNYIRQCVVYTGTHDNDTAVGWFHSQAGEGTTRQQDRIEIERARTLAYTGTDGSEIHWDMIRLALASVADTAVFPLQDLLGLGSEARMNLPGTVGNNWRWRFRWEMLTPQIEKRLLKMTEAYGRTAETAASPSSAEKPQAAVALQGPHKRQLAPTTTTKITP